MFAAIIAIGLPIIIFALGFLFLNKNSNEYDKKKVALIGLSVSFTLIGLYIYAIASLYENLLEKYPEIKMTRYEAEYFAIQTLTTVGYGANLCYLPEDIGTGIEDIDTGLSFEDTFLFRTGFHRLGSIAMTGWLVVWLVVGTCSLHFIEQILSFKMN